MTEDYRRKWQEFYGCECGQNWWGWSSDRRPLPETPATIKSPSAAKI